MFVYKHNATDDAAVIHDAIIAIRLARFEYANLFPSGRISQDRCPLRDDPVLEIEIDVIRYASNRYPKGKGKREKENDKKGKREREKER
jgi:hypothetical protein